jgi:O-antigen ligase
VLLPLVLIYAFHVWNELLRRKWVRSAAVVLFIAGAVAYVALGIRNFTGRSMYTDRERVVQAIDERNYRLLGERRTESWPVERRGE